MKKKLSRIAAMLLAVVMVITGIAVMPSTDVNAAGKPTFTFETTTSELHPGDEFTATLYLEAGSNVSTFALMQTYDTNTLELTKVAKGYDLVMNGYAVVIDDPRQPDFVPGEIAYFIDYGSTITERMEIATLTFKVKDNASGSTQILAGFAGAMNGDEIVAPEGNENMDFTMEGPNGVIEDGTFPVIIELEDLAINQDDFTMAKGTTDKLSVTATPEAALTGKTVDWSSSDDRVVKVDQDGNIEAAGIGTATITASCEEFSDTVTVTVNAPLTGITLNTLETSIKKGDTADLDVIYTPEDTTDDTTVIWTSSDDTVATVDDNGVVTALKDGETTITATVGDLTAECLVHVREVPLEGIELDKSAITMNKGEESEALKVSYNPEDTTDDKTVTWSSENEDVAMVEDGVVTAVGAGTTTITAKVGEFTATCEVTVLSPLESISVVADGDTDSLEVGDTVQLNVEYNPSDTTDDKTVTWTSSDDTVATVDENGLVTAMKGGTATITADVNGHSATCDIKVLIHTTGISLGSEELQLVKGQVSDPIEVTYDPENTDDSKDLTWISSDDTVATVDENGAVTAVGGGTATITAMLNADESIYAECVVTVSVPLESISVEADGDTDSLEVGDTVKLTVGYNPEDTTDGKDVTWTSSNEDVATVDENGVVTAAAGGTATITATSAANADISATCDIKVLKHTESITLSQAEDMILMKNESSDPVTVTFDPADTDDSKEVEWTTSDADVATVDNNGVVTGVAEGTATITAKVAAGEGTASASFDVIVNEIHVEDARLADTTPSELYIGQAYDIQVIITPDYVTDEVTYTYASSDESVAAVDENGTVNALAAGRTDITVTVKAGEFTKDLTFTLDVKEIPLESIAFKQEVTPMEEGQKAQLEIIFNPENTTIDKTVTWASSDESVAAVDENGLLTAVKAGTATISATAGGKEVSYELTVTEKKEPENPGTGDNDGQSGQTGDNGNNGQNTGDDGQNSGDKVNNQNNGGAVQTGDTTNIFGVILTMLISLSVAALVVMFRGRGKRIHK